MSQNFPQNEPSRRPSYGIPAEQSAQQHSGAPQYGAPAGTNGQYSQPAQPTQTASHAPYSANPQPNQNAPFGGYGTPQYSPAQPSAPQKKKKPVGTILAILGALGILLGVGVLIFSVVKGFGQVANIASSGGVTSTNSTLNGTTATFDFEAKNLNMIMVYVPEADAANATCSAALKDGGAALTESNEQSSSDGQLTINGVSYVQYKRSFISSGQEGPATLKCENVSAPVSVVGPIDAGSMVGWGLGGSILGIIIALIGLALLIAGVIVMIVRAAKRRSA